MNIPIQNYNFGRYNIKLNNVIILCDIIYFPILATCHDWVLTDNQKNYIQILLNLGIRFYGKIFDYSSENFFLLQINLSYPY